MNTKYKTSPRSHTSSVVNRGPERSCRPVGSVTLNCDFKKSIWPEPDPAIDGQYAATDAAGWITWKKSMLAEVGEMIDIGITAGSSTQRAGNQEQVGID